MALNSRNTVVPTGKKYRVNYLDKRNNKHSYMVVYAENSDDARESINDTFKGLPFEVVSVEDYK